MELPQEIRLKTEQLAAAENIKPLTDAAEKLSLRYREQSGGGKRLVSTRRDIIAYAAVRMPATFGAVSRALELALECFDDEITSVLDAGAGTGAAAIAAALLTECPDITCLEREQCMTDMGKALSEAAGLGFSWINRDLSDGITERADLVTCAYCLNEMTPAQRTAAVKQLAEAARKMLVIIEPGTPAGFAQLKEARRQLIGMGMKIAAPCPNTGECPLPADDWCHFTARIQRSKLHKRLKGGDAPYEDEKFCFIAAVRQECSPCSARVLRHPRIESGRITLRLCTADGICDKIYTAKSSLFKAARKSDSGDNFPDNTK
ncbi:MAG: small ribosomal subunit Rsm22 family protein [Oscillospiraceae bacterium]